MLAAYASTLARRTGLSVASTVVPVAVAGPSVFARCYANVVDGLKYYEEHEWPTHVPTLLERGEVALRQGDLMTAEIMFRRAADTARVIKSCDLDNDGDQDLIVGTTWNSQNKLLIKNMFNLESWPRFGCIHDTNVHRPIKQSLHNIRRNFCHAIF